MKEEEDEGDLRCSEEVQDLRGGDVCFKSNITPPASSPSLPVTHLEIIKSPSPLIFYISLKVEQNVRHVLHSTDRITGL